MNEPSSDPASGPFPPETKAPSAGPMLDARDLFQGHKEIRIDHHGEIYRLRITSRGRLILQK